jgi:hypothetical protein
MTDYFGALMNSSGINRSSKPLRGAAAADANSDVNGIEPKITREVQAGPTAASLQMAGQTEPAEAPTRMAANENPAEEAESLDSPRAGAPIVGRLQDTPLTAKPGPSAATTDLVSAIFTPAADEKAADARGGTLVRAAMEWVGADPQNVLQPSGHSREAYRSATRPVPTGHPPSQDHSSSIAASIDVAAVPARSVASTAQLSPERIIDQTSDGFSRPVVRPVAATADEVVEVSIGTINIRVDAPAAPATRITPAPAAPSRSQSSSDRGSASSSLARRALRRI